MWVSVPNKKMECGYTQFFFSFCSDNSLHLIEMFHSGKLPAFPAGKLIVRSFLRKFTLSAHWSGRNRAQVGLYIDFNNLAGNSFAWLVWSGRPKAAALLDTWSLEFVKRRSVLDSLIWYNSSRIKESWQGRCEPQKATWKEGFMAL